MSESTNKYVSVHIQNKTNPEQYSLREYTYKDGIGLVVGDKVICPAGTGKAKGIVTKIGLTENDVAENIKPFIKEITELDFGEEKEATSNESSTPEV